MVRGAIDRTIAWLSGRRRLAAGLFAAALLLYAPTLGGGLVLDDVAQQAFMHAKLAGGERDKPWWALFHLVTPSREQLLGQRTAGRVPWWTHPELRIVFFRPLASADAYVDALAWPRTPWLMHLHGLLLYALLCALVLRLYRRLASPEGQGIAALAAAIFLVDPTHAAPVAWLAQRNAVIAALLMVAAVLAHLRWRAQGRRRWLLVSVVGLIAALLSAEVAITALALVVAYAWTLDPGGRWRGLLAAAPAVALASIYLFAYGAMGFGARASGAYLDPLRDPSTFLGALPERVLALIAAALALPMPLVWRLFGGPTPDAWVLRAIGAVFLLWLLRHVLWDMHDPRLRFAALAFLLALVPISAAPADERLLLLASVPGALWLALVIVGLGRSARRVHRGVALALAAVHLLLAPAALMVAFAGQQGLSFGGSALPTGPTLANEALGHQTLLVVQAPSTLHGLMLPLARGHVGLSVPRFSFVLASSGAPSTWTRTGPRSFELEQPHGLLRDSTAAFFRSPSAPLRPGEVVSTLAFRAEILAVTRDGHPSRVRFDFAADPEHMSVCFATWDGREFVALKQPATGESVTLPGR
ncbi:hypothetical protein [Nannocystis punicea]|uniref:Glycosyltransferase RgtA/B/C/D-like domain-containing protein n=1 Tax=Nannocystis punicea TaxID=2995304 RepID=A0ABY7HG90_9BACT|nr:hypothetical protein [Nannocystis poenicansa]WAS98303.1 hypothetical protein O0S08_19345 [Nannocystis poenicansa]